MTAVDVLRGRPATRADGGTWAWGQRALTRIGELEALSHLMEHRQGASPDAARLAQDTRQHLATARQAVDRGRWGVPGSGGARVDCAMTNIDVAACLVLRYAPLVDVQAMLPDLVAFVGEQLPARDLRRVDVESILRHTRKDTLTEPERGRVVAAVRAAYAASEREHVRVRSFRNLVYGVTACLALVAVAVAVATATRPRMLPICFQPGETVVCPTGDAPFAGGDLDTAVASVVSSWDYVVLEAVGLVAAAVASAAALRQVKGTSTPFGVPVALAILKLPTGALTAVLGLLLMRGQFVPGLSALDTSAQIVAWAVVFGYAQQLLTRLVDERGQAVLDAVGGPENPKDQAAGLA